MAPGLISPSPGDGNNSAGADMQLFPDGFKTSGQHEPVYAKIRPYEEFPKEIAGPTVWKKEDFQNNPEKWQYAFTADDVAELGRTADAFMETGRPLTAITKDQFHLPTVGPVLAKLRDTLVNGQGFWLFKNIPVKQWGPSKCATAYMGIGTHIGWFVSQNSRGHILGHVKDLGEDATQLDKVRTYRTNARQPFHTDHCDVVGLLCLAKSMEGGESDIVSMQHVFNIFQREHPELARLMVEPTWYYDRKNEISEGQKPWMRQSIFYLEDKPGADRRVYGKLNPSNIKSMTRFQTGPDAVLPPVSQEQSRILALLDEICKREAMHMVLEPGDVQFLANSHNFHSRTAYKDWTPGSVDDQGQPLPQRHLMRLWLAVPEDEGGWKLPYPDCHLKKRGGIQVNDTPPVCPLDAE